MNTQQIHLTAVTLTNSPMIRDMSDHTLVVEHRHAKAECLDVVRLAIELEMERRGELRDRARAYFNAWKTSCTNEQLDRVAAKFDVYGSLAVWAGAEVVARCEWSV